MGNKSIKHEAFVYEWRNIVTKEWYLGYHIGSEDDGYVSSSKVFDDLYKASPQNWQRRIVAYGTAEQMYAWETGYLKCALKPPEGTPVNGWSNGNAFSKGKAGEDHGRSLLSGILSMAGEQKGIGTPKNFFVIYVEGILASCNPMFISASQRKNIESMVGKPVNVTVTQKGEYLYFSPSNISEVINANTGDT